MRTQGYGAHVYRHLYVDIYKDVHESRFRARHDEFQAKFEALPVIRIKQNYLSAKDSN